MRPIVVHTGAPRSPVAGLPIARVGIALLVAWCGCAGPGTRELSLAPLAGQHAGQSVVRRPGQHVEQTRERDLLWPLINQRETATETGWGVRPLFFTRQSKQGLGRETTFLWPLGRYSEKPGEVEFRLTPLFSYKARTTERGTIDRDWIVFPTFFFGSDDREGDYFAFLPFFGETRGLLVRERMEFVLFPLYLRTYDGAYSGLNVLFPLFASGEGNDREVFTLFPFYLRQAKAGRYDKRTYLWPLFHDHRLNLHQRDPVRILSFWPLYGQERSQSGDITARSFLWPFFGYRIHRSTGYEEYDVPWPFFRYLRSEKIDHDRLWPLWSSWRHKQRGIHDRQVLWPIGWHSVEEDHRQRKRGLWILPLFWDLRTVHKDDPKTPADESGVDRYTKLWPLFHRQRSRAGDYEVAVISPWWFRDAEPFGFRDNYDPLFTLFYYGHLAAERESLTSVLGPVFRLYSRGEAAWRLQLLVFRYGREGQGEAARRSWSVLEGLAGYESDNGRHTLRLLWLPIRWGQPRTTAGGGR